MQTLLNPGDGCPWYYFDNSYKILLGACLIIFGIFGVLLNGWLFATFVHSNLVTFKSHILVLNLCSASLGRNLLGFPFSASSATSKRWLFSPACCQLHAFLNQFLGIFQMYALFTLVLERYVLAKCYQYERKLCLEFYWILIGVCWLISFTFATPPLFGYGTYACDLTGTSCSLLWPTPTSGAKQLGFYVPYIVICGIVPVVAIFYFTGKAVRLELIYYRGERLKEQKQLTKNIYIVSIMTLGFWVPAAVLAGWQLYPLLTPGYRLPLPPVLALIAPIASEAAPSVPVLCYLAGDERLRAALLGRVREQYALLSPILVKRYNQA